MKKIKKITVAEMDLLRNELASVKGGAQDNPVGPFNANYKTNQQSIVAPAPYKGEWGIHGSIYF
ncbi:hypothetical protein [uncultured Muribaculum sp.]|jgi:hypothetical protein|uniref:hypothetical protein n=1 Tax=uncultured Muribaculum sp. TaxID=1918613 RepID=UPI00272E0C22|nr:hypothetical protein [uncultured Muribaculum sp.]